jgi:hypothetical protein
MNFFMTVGAIILIAILAVAYIWLSKKVANK